MRQSFTQKPNYPMIELSHKARKQCLRSSWATQLSINDTITLFPLQGFFQLLKINSSHLKIGKIPRRKSSSSSHIIFQNLSQTWRVKGSNYPSTIHHNIYTYTFISVAGSRFATWCSFRLLTHFCQVIDGLQPKDQTSRSGYHGHRDRRFWSGLNPRERVKMATLPWAKVGWRTWWVP